MPETNNHYSLQSVIEFINNKFALILIMGTILIAGFFVGSLWTENQVMKSGGSPKVALGTGTGTAPAAPDTAPGAPAGPSGDQLKNMPEVSDDDWTRGNKNANIVLVEYSDYECPFCQRFHDTMSQVMEEYGDKVAWVYRHYPLSFHANAQKASEAAECIGSLAGEEAFWKFTDNYFERTTSNGTGIALTELANMGAEVGANKVAVQSCLDNDEMATKVGNSFTAGSAAGVSGTPGTLVVVDGEVQELIPGALPFEQVQQIIEKYL